MTYTNQDAAFDAEHAHGIVYCPKHGKNCDCCERCGETFGHGRSCDDCADERRDLYDDQTHGDHDDPNPSDIWECEYCGDWTAPGDDHECHGTASEAHHARMMG